MKIAIIGPPKSGKTTYSQKLEGVVKHTDDLIELGWSGASQVASEWFDDESIDVVEGVAVPRAIRKWLDRNKGNDTKPVGKVIKLEHTFIELIDGQKRMAKGIETVWEGIEKELIRRGVVIEKR